MGIFQALRLLFSRRDQRAREAQFVATFVASSAYTGHDVRRADFAGEGRA